VHPSALPDASPACRQPITLVSKWLQNPRARRFIGERAFGKDLGSRALLALRSVLAPGRTPRRSQRGLRPSAASSRSGNQYMWR